MESLTEFMVNAFEFVLMAGILLVATLFFVTMLGILTYGFWDSFVRRRKRKHLNDEFQQDIHSFENFAYRPDDDLFVVGLRYARIVYDKKNGLCFCSVTQNYHFAAEQRKAICGLGFQHVAPDAECSCGFYSLRDYNKLCKLEHNYGRAGSVALEVRVGGEIIEGPHGLRSEYQTVERVWLPLSCSNRFCKQRAQHMTMQIRHNVFERTRATLVQKCDNCLEDADHIFPIQTLRNGLKTEVEWGLAPG